MRVKRAKSYKRHMSLYHFAFGFRQPYQVLVDSSFCLESLKCQMKIKKQVPRILHGDAKLMITQCVINELYSQCENVDAAKQLVRDMEKRRCPHREEAVSAHQCISEIIADTNPHNYCVSSQDPNLRELLRCIPGVPLLYINRSVLILEPPSEETLEHAQRAEMKKIHAKKEELDFLQRRNPEALAKKKEEEERGKKRKRKGPKGPNPLSVKKSKKKKEEGDKREKKAEQSAGGTTKEKGESVEKSKEIVTEQEDVGETTKEDTAVGEEKTGKKRRRRRKNRARSDKANTSQEGDSAERAGESGSESD
ncbi:uncharacterized protein VTP21DRAFT_2676 [Calcarisporiella thermophila]|uniref:uncharacterized protein n=1 Tax=Calcarisporiella thermophila TaxID=911321 RepID=UPI0037421BEA